MKKRHLLFYMLIALLLAACTGKEQVREKPVSIYLQPYDNFTQQEAMKLKTELDTHLQEILNDSFIVKVLPNKPLTRDLLNDAKTRYKGERIISSLKDSPSTTIALTHKDISIEYNGKKDWGVLGVSFRKTPPCNACAVSDYRLKNKKRDFWKVVVHEFIHTHYAYSHCPKDSTHCIMKDAKGHADFSNKNGLCGYCKNRI